jgi:hypothetical protein
MPSFRQILMSSNNRTGILVGLALLLLSATACTSRYRLEMFMVSGEQRSKIKIEKTEYFMGVVLGDPESKDKVIRGDGNCLVLVSGNRGQGIETKREDLITFDRYERLRIFLQLPAKPQAGTISLINNSFMDRLGRYELEHNDRVYFPTDGHIVIDSVSDGRLYGSLDGRYENGNHDSLTFQGRFRAKVAK